MSCIISFEKFVALMRAHLGDDHSIMNMEQGYRMLKLTSEKFEVYLPGYTEQYCSEEGFEAYMAMGPAEQQKLSLSMLQDSGMSVDEITDVVIELTEAAMSVHNPADDDISVEFARAALSNRDIVRVGVEAVLAQ